MIQIFDEKMQNLALLGYLEGYVGSVSDGIFSIILRIRARKFIV